MKSIAEYFDPAKWQGEPQVRPRYRILPAPDVGGGESLLCGICGRQTFHPMDVKNRYCGHCHEFLDD